MTIYFLRHADLIKIGFTSHLQTRMKSILTAVPGGAELLGHMPGERDVESHFHAVFAADRFSGEWFAVSDRLLAVIDAIAIKELPSVDMPKLIHREEQDQAWRVVSKRVRAAAARRWPDLQHQHRMDAIAALLGWGSRRVKALYNAQPGMVLRDHEARDLQALLMTDAETMAPNDLSAPTQKQD
jgi:hypothetical protein